MKIKKFNFNKNNKMIMYLILFIFTLLITSCSSSKSIDSYDPARIGRCETMNKSLKPDISIAGSVEMIAGKLNIDRANSLTEANLVAMQSIHASCMLWAKHDISTVEFKEQLGKLIGAVSAYKEVSDLENSFNINKTEIDHRISKFEFLAKDLGIEIEKNIIERERQFAYFISSLNDYKDSLAAIEEKIGFEKSEFRSAFLTLENSLVSNDKFSDLEKEIRELKSIVAKYQNDEINKIVNRSVEHANFIHGISIYFETSSSEIDESMKNRLNIFIDSIKDVRQHKIRVVGFADFRGNKEANLTLSQNRAKSVVEYLSKNNISVENYFGLGESIAFGVDNLNNRRALIEVFYP